MDTAGIFATYPGPHLTVMGGFLDQVVSTGLLVTVVLAMNDKKNIQIPNGTGVIIAGMTVILLGATFGYNCGYALNPTRDIGPRFFTYIAGWGSQTFTAGNYFFWIPIVAPMVGSLIATILYTIIISNNLK